MSRDHMITCAAYADSDKACDGGCALLPGAPVCPACDLMNADLPPFESMALGVGVGLAKKEIHAVTESMCRAHRIPWVLAMAKLNEALAAAAK